MKTALHIFLWTAIVALTALPALSNAGYPPYSVEYLFTLALAYALGTLLYYAGHIRYLNTLLLLLFVSFPVALYFGNFFLTSGWRLGAGALAAAGFAAFSHRRFDKALLLVGSVAFAQIAAVAIATPSYIVTLEEKQVARADIPSVIHILLDEHAGLAAIPPGAVPPEQVRTFANEYVHRGFTVFTHAYTADYMTELTVARLMNLDKVDISKLIKHGSLAGFDLNRHTTLDQIAKNRTLDLTINKHIVPKKISKDSLARWLVYDAAIAAGPLRTYSLSLKERLGIAAYLAAGYLYKGLHAPLVEWYLTRTAWGLTLEPYINGRTHVGPIASRHLLQETVKRLQCCGERGTYYFAHFILPHYIFLLDDKCHMRPVSTWENPRFIDSGHPHNLQRLYAQHFAQATCAQQEILALINTLEKHEKLSDAVVFIHSDHGVKLSWAARDLRGSFLAVRIPGRPGGIIDMPVRLDTFYRNFMENNFLNFEPEKLLPLEDSPY